MSRPNYRKMMEQEAAEEEARRAEQEREAAAQAQADTETPEASPDAVTIPAPGGEVDPGAPAAPEEPYRPQPFTPDLLPEPKEIAAEGELSAEEVDELGHCEAAYGNANKAEWMKWMAAHAVRSRRLYRHDGRTWPEYCEDKFGESESEVNRRIQQWPLLKKITEHQDSPRSIPDSHVQGMLPMVETHGEDITVFTYIGMRRWGTDRKTRITADVVAKVVELAQRDEDPVLPTPNLFQQALEAKPKPASKQNKRVTPAPETPPAGSEGADGPEQSEPDSHPNLGDSQKDTGPQPDRDDEHQEPVPTTETEAAAGAAGGDEEQDQDQDAADPLAERAAQAASMLEGMTEGFVAGGILRHATEETLKTITATALQLAEAADEELRGR